MQPTSVIDNKVLELSGFGRVLFVAGSNVKVVGVTEATSYATCFLSLKHIGFCPYFYPKVLVEP